MRNLLKNSIAALILFMVSTAYAYEPQFSIPDPAIDQNFKNLAAEVKANKESAGAGDVILAATQTFTGSNTFTQTGTGVTSISSATIGSLNVTGETRIIRGSSVSATTSGTYVDITNIPAWASRLTISLNGVSWVTGDSKLVLQLGDSGGVETTGYVAMLGSIHNTNNTTRYLGSTTYFPIEYTGDASKTVSGTSTCNKFPATNVWQCTSLYYGTNGVIAMGQGNKTTSTTLDRVRLTTTSGTSTLDLGSMVVFWE